MRYYSPTLKLKFSLKIRACNIARPNRQVCRLTTATVGTTAMGQIYSAGKVCKIQHMRRVMRPCCDDKKLFLSPSNGECYSPPSRSLRRVAAAFDCSVVIDAKLGDKEEPESASSTM